MTTPNLVILYVEDPVRSAAFYEQVLGQPPIGTFPNYIAFRFGNGLHLGLWSIYARNFVSSGAGHRFELSVMVDNEAEVDHLHEAWKTAGVTIEQPPEDAVFGRTFVALDPDGHRLRICIPDR